MRDAECRCVLPFHDPKLVVLTGGPGAGKTAVLEVVRKHFCEHVEVLPESASILFKGGFPRRPTRIATTAAQRAIFRVQRELEELALNERHAAVALCDRGTVDGIAYWPDSPESLFASFGTTLEQELHRYAAVIHLRTPSELGGYDHTNPVRIETAAEASVIDRRIQEAWNRHPRRFIVENHVEFIDKLARVIALIRNEVPSCCRSHPIPELSRAMA